MFEQFKEIFNRARQAKTLEIMVMAQVRKQNLVYDPSLNSYAVVAKSYAKVNKQAEAMFKAAAARLQELKKQQSQDALTQQLQYALGAL